MDRIDQAAEFKAFFRTYAPAWMGEKIWRMVLSPGSVARTIFELGRLWEQQQQAKKDARRIIR